MTEVIVPDRPVLVTVPSVELIHAGTWQISTGEWNVTSGDLYAAVAALNCPAVRRPVLKLGHTDPRFDGEPAIGWVDNLAVSTGGVQLVGDYCGLPAWLGDVLASAYPDRSIEGQYDFVCQIGHTHPFVLTAVALLGITAPGVGTLASLQDIAALYGVAAAAADTDTAFRLPITAKGHPMPTTLTVAASATVEDVRRSFYEGPAAANWWWIEDLFVDPTEVVAIDDEDGRLWRVPFTVAADGTVTWGEAQQVKREYVAAAAGGRKPLASWASRTESRPTPPAEPPRAAAPSAAPAEVTPPKEDDVSSTLTEGLRQRLGITDADADDAALLTALDEALAERAEPEPPGPAAPTLPEGTVAIEAETLAQLQAAARRGDEARTRQEREEREALVSAAISDGRIPPARRQHWLTQLEADPGAATTLASLAKGLVPVSETGHGQNPQAATADQDLSWFDSAPKGA